MAESSSKIVTTKVPILPPGFRFDPTDLGLVRRYLRNRVEKNESEFITELEVYSDVPWRLVHVDNPLFKKKEWYYFVKRTKRGGKTPKRTVQGRGESEGGTWKSTGVNKAIMDENKKVHGYKRSLVFFKGKKPVAVKTDWLMTEYSLHNDVHDDWVLCWIRDRTEKKGNPVFVDQVPQVENNILPNQVQEQGVGSTVSASGPEMMMSEGEHGGVTQQQQQYTPIVPPLLQSQDLGFMTMMHNNNNNNNNNNNVMTLFEGEQYQYQQQQRYASVVPPLLQSQDLGFGTIMHSSNNNNNNFVMMSEGEQYQQQHQYTSVLPPLLQSQNSGFGTMMHSNDSNNVMMMMYEGENYQQQQQYTSVVPPLLQSQELGFGTMMHSNNNNNNVVMMSNQEQNQHDDFVFNAMLEIDQHDFSERMMFNVDENLCFLNDFEERWNMEGDTTQQQRHDDDFRFDGSEDLTFGIDGDDYFKSLTSVNS